MNSFSSSAKVASVRIIFKKDDKTNIKHYKTVSLLSCFPKIHEKFLNKKLLNFVNHSLSNLMSAYRKRYSTNHVLIHLENSSKPLGNIFLQEQFLWIYRKRLTAFCTIS